MSDLTNISVDQVVGLDLFALKPVVAYDYPEAPQQVVSTYQPGDRVGTVYSYVLRNEQVWWMMGTNGPYVKHEPGMFDLDALEQQGALTSKQEQREKQLATAGIIEKYMLKAWWGIQDNKKLQTAMYIAVGIVVFLLIMKALKITGFDFKTLKIKRK